MKTYRGRFRSTNSVSGIAYYVTVPDGKPKCIVQIAHGMCEKIPMYREFMEYLADNGCIACGHDALGHGNSARNYSELGFFAEKNGWICLVRDMKKLTDIVRSKYPDLPVFLIGHSMGSFVLREYLTWYGSDISGAILLGTSDGFEGQKSLVRLARAMCLLCDGRYHNRLVLKTGCIYFCSKLGKVKAGWDWLSRDRKVRDYMDRYSFGYTARAYYDIITLLDVISAPDWTQSIRKDMPILLMSGLADAVGNCGRGVAKLYNRLKSSGCTKLKVRLYDGARHMLIHETNREQVYDDIMKWINENRRT